LARFAPNYANRAPQSRSDLKEQSPGVSEKLSGVGLRKGLIVAQVSVRLGEAFSDA
jgi:hypothetical protein